MNLKPVMLSIAKFFISKVFTKELMNSVVDNVQFYMTDDSFTSDEKAQIVKDNAKATAKSLGLELTSSAANLLLEMAVAYVKSRI